MSEIKKVETPTIYEYLDYREFLKDVYLARRQIRRSISFRRFAQNAGLASPMHLKLVIDGKRNLTHKTIPKFRKGLKLSEREGDYFENLVLFNQTSTTEEKSRYFEKLSAIRQKQKSRALTKKEQGSLYENPLFPVLVELAKVKGFEATAEWVEKALKSSVGRVEIKRALKTLEDQGFLSRLDDTRLVARDSMFKTVDEVEDLFVRKFHLHMMEKAAKHVDDPLQERNFRFLTVATTEERFEKFKKAAKEFFGAANHQLTAPDGVATGILQINLQSFWDVKVDQ